MLLALIFLFFPIITSFIIYKSNSDSEEAYLLIVIHCLLGLIIYPCLWIAICPFAGGFWEGYSEGNQVGYVTKISKKGMIFKTWEGQIQLGSGNMAALQDPICFSVAEENLLPQLSEAIDKGNKVKLTYKQWLITPAWVGKNSRIIHKIQVLE